MAGLQRDFFRALYKVAQVVNSTLEPEEVLGKIVHSVAKAMEVKAANIRLLGDRGKRLIMGGSCGLSRGYIQKGPILVSESGLDREALEGKAVYVANAQVDKGWQYPVFAKEEGIFSVLAVPLMSGDKAVGVLRVYTDSIREFDEEEIMFLEAAANLSATALENARLHAALKRDYDLLIKNQERLDDN